MGEVTNAVHEAKDLGSQLVAHLRTVINLFSVFVEAVESWIIYTGHAHDCQVCETECIESPQKTLEKLAPDVFKHFNYMEWSQIAAALVLDTGDGGTYDITKEPMVESLDQIAVEHEWNRLLLHGPQPPPRSKHAAVAVGRKMFVTGGTSPIGTRNDVQVFHAEKLKWEPLDCRPPLSDLRRTRGEQYDAHCPSCTGHSLVFWERQFVLVGCETGPAFKTVTVFSLDVASRSWSTLSPKGNAPATRTGHTVVQVASMLVLFGGEDMKGRTLNDIYILELKTLLWLPLETSGTKPSPRRDHCAVAYSERFIWIFGGKHRTTYYNGMYCLDLQKMEWTKEKSRGPTARAGHSGATAGNMWYIVGGESPRNDALNTLAFNLDSHQWSEFTNIRSGSPLANDGISLTKIQIKRKTFLVAFGGRDANLSNQIYVMMLPSIKQLESFVDETPSDTSSDCSASFDSALSIQPALRDPRSPYSVRTSDASVGDGTDTTPESTLSLGESLLRSGRIDDGFVDQETNFRGDKERVLDSQDPSTATKANDEEAPDQTCNASPDERRGFAETMDLVQTRKKLPSPVSNCKNRYVKESYGFMSISRDLDPNPQNGIHEPEVSWNLNERLLAALNLNEDLQNRLLRAQKAKAELEQALSANLLNTDILEQQVLTLLTAKAEGEWKLEKSRQKLEELERKLNSSPRPQKDPDSRFQSKSRDEIITKPNSLRTKLFEESIFSTETETGYEMQRRLAEAESKLAAVVDSQLLTESKLGNATRELLELSDKTAIAMQMTKESCSACKTLVAENLRLKRELLAVAALRDTRGDKGSSSSLPRSMWVES